MIPMMVFGCWLEDEEEEDALRSPYYGRLYC